MCQSAPSSNHSEHAKSKGERREKLKGGREKRWAKNPRLSLRAQAIWDKYELSPFMENDLSSSHFWATLTVKCKNPTRFSDFSHPSFRRFYSHFCHHRHRDGHHEKRVVRIGLFHLLLDFPRHFKWSQVPECSPKCVTHRYVKRGAGLGPVSLPVRGA